jgi:hypothetical protein
MKILEPIKKVEIPKILAKVSIEASRKTKNNTQNALAGPAQPSSGRNGGAGGGGEETVRTRPSALRAVRQKRNHKDRRVPRMPVAPSCSEGLPPPHCFCRSRSAGGGARQYFRRLSVQAVHPSGGRGHVVTCCSSVGSCGPLQRQGALRWLLIKGQALSSAVKRAGNLMKLVG